MTPLGEVLRRLATEGFSDDLVADDGGLRSTATGKIHDVGDLIVREIVRFEGDTDPGDEAIVVAVATSNDSPVGTFTTPYGPLASAREADILRRLGPLTSGRPSQTTEEA